MNLEVSLISIIFLLLFFKIYTSAYSDRTVIIGDLIEVSKDMPEIDGLKWDITTKTKILIPSFQRIPSFFRKLRMYHKLKNKQCIYFDFHTDDIKGEWRLFLYEKDFRLIKTYYNPRKILFTSDSDKEDAEYLEEDKEYIFIIKYSSDTLDELDYNVIKYQNSNYANYDRYHQRDDIYLDEEILEDEMKKKQDKIIKEMKAKGYSFLGVKNSRERVLFPSNELTYFTEIKAFKGDVIVIQCANKKGIENHHIEIDSKVLSQNWYPGETPDDIAMLILDNSDMTMKYNIYERMSNIKTDSKLIPFRILRFKV